MVGWTLIHEMYFYLVFFLILLMVPEKRFIDAILLWGAVIVCMNIYSGLISPFTDLLFHPLTIEFILGCLIAINFHRKNNHVLETKPLLIIRNLVNRQSFPKNRVLLPAIKNNTNLLIKAIISHLPVTRMI